MSLLQVGQMGRVPVWLRLQEEHQHWRGPSHCSKERVVHQEHLGNQGQGMLQKSHNRLHARDLVVVENERLPLSRRGKQAYQVVRTGFKEIWSTHTRKTLSGTVGTQGCWHSVIEGWVETSSGVWAVLSGLTNLSNKCRARVQSLESFEILSS